MRAKHSSHGLLQNTIREVLNKVWLSLTFSKEIFFGNGLFAIISGLFANLLADNMGLGHVASFHVAACFLTLGMAIILSSSTENFGDPSDNKDLLTQFKGAAVAIAPDEKIALLGAIQSLFEGSMYTFVFLWTPPLSPNDEDIPHGFIFTTFILSSLASFLGSKVCSTYGRKMAMLVASIFYLLGVIMNAAANGLILLILGRIMFGIGVGFGNEDVPLFLFEIAPVKIRGAVNILSQLFVTLGILIANMVNFGSLSSVSLSESEESGDAEIKSKDKGKRAAEIDEKPVQNFPKITTSGSSRKNKMRDDDFGSTVRRPGRGGRSSAAGRSSVSRAVDKLDDTITAKQLRSARHGSDKIVSKVGCPPNRKLSDRKAYTHPRHTMNSGVQYYLGESHDVHEELLAAANAAADPGLACSSPFWRQMEPLFSVISADEINYQKQQATLGSNPLKPTIGGSYRDNCSTIPNIFELIECNGDKGIASEAKKAEYLSEHSILTRPDYNVNPLYQRLISALVSEEDIEEFRYTGDDETSFGWDAELKAIPLN